MGNQKQDMEIKGEFELNSVVYLLEDLVTSMRKGQIYAQQNTDSIVLQPSNNIGLKFTANSDENQQEFTVKLSWPTDSNEQ